jgi:UDPglucose 6-dehydrogenase
MARLAVVGSGVVGQATGKGFAAFGHDVTFCDINPEVLETLKGQGHTVCSPERLTEQEDFSAIFLPISTPTVDGKIELKFLRSAVVGLAKGYLKDHSAYCVVVVRSTVPPGTTEEQIIPLLEQHSGKRAGVDFGVCMNPEYLREGSNEEDFKNPWIVVIGELDARSGKVIEEAYGDRKCPIEHVPLRAAEAQKYIHNLYNAAKISFFNEMRIVCEEMRIDADAVFSLVAKSAEASWNREYGIKNMGPFGGSCLPKDTAAFFSWAKDVPKLSLHLLHAVIRVNDLVRERAFARENP